ncbi:hypothetical protein [uncultured Phascolarctobacterium sp.]|uniref:hypothetical protein n=1 Tax=uncultured Phascolarctobacterium sp. TaxID=512296 RepID=UPI002635082B|nr:hypothetical protein [uncultured Phascolarctobacterium sp.]
MLKIKDCSEHTALVVALAAIILSLLCGSCYNACKQRRAGVCTDGVAVPPVDEQLERARKNQQELTKRVSDAEGTAKDIAGAVRDADKAAGNLESQLRDAGEIIAECKQILARVQIRDAKKAE